MSDLFEHAATLIDRTRARFSKTARSCPGSREARGDGPQVRGPPAVRGRGLTDDLVEGPAEAPEAGEAHVQADLADAAVGLPQQEHRSLHAATLQIAMWRLAEGGAKGPDEVCLGDPGDPREG